MNAAKLLNRIPSLFALASLAYAYYSVQGTLESPTGASANLEKGLNVMVKDVIDAGADELRGIGDAAFRDPFRTGTAQETAAVQAEAAAADNDDVLAEVVKCLTLDATFVQGKTQIAVINGREYSRGQHLVVENDGVKSYSQLYVASVHKHRVTLSARTKTYDLAYSDSLAKPAGSEKAGSKSPTAAEMAEIDPADELAFYKRLSNSPLGKLGKSLTGNIGATKPGAAGAPRARRAKRS